MCGIAGYLGPGAVGIAPDALLRAMAATLAHRGPDGQDTWCDQGAGIGLAHRRLSVIDVSDGGRQPMASRDGRFVIVFNGEIYNFEDLRRDLDASGGARAWRGHSDTEVLVELIARDGVEAALPRLNGMFAFGLWDRLERRLTLARDPFGEKPLYFGLVNGSLLFASELKALRAFPGFAAPIDPLALSSYLRYGYVPSPLSIYRDVWKLPAGAYLQVRPGDEVGPGAARAYWDPARSAAEALADPFTGSAAEAVDELDRLLRDAVRARMVSDVPLGCLLSGGIDSSLVAALMQAQSDRPVRTFSLGSNRAGYDETPVARRVARALGTDHAEIRIDARAALDLIPRMSLVYDEPFADSSQIPTYLVSEFARTSVTVALSGDGGDELFGGYNRYTHAPRVWSYTRGWPAPLRRAVAGGIAAIGPEQWNWLAQRFSAVFPGELRAGRAGEKLHKLAGVVRHVSEDALHEALLSVDPEPELLLAAGTRPLGLVGRATFPDAAAALAQRAMLLDTANYLPDDILVKVDRASMAHSLELRSAYLDTRLYAFAWRLPHALKVEGATGKVPLRRLLARHVPAEVTERAKQGFAIPIGQWLRRELRDWGETLLSRRRLADDGFFDPAAVRRIWDQHQAGRRNWDARLWSLLMFQSWLDRNRAEPQPAPRMVAEA